MKIVYSLEIVVDNQECHLGSPFYETPTQVLNFFQEYKEACSQFGQEVGDLKDKVYVVVKKCPKGKFRVSDNVTHWDIEKLQTANKVTMFDFEIEHGC